MSSRLSQELVNCSTRAWRSSPCISKRRSTEPGASFGKTGWCAIGFLFLRKTMDESQSQLRMKKGLLNIRPRRLLAQSEVMRCSLQKIIGSPIKSGNELVSFTKNVGEARVMADIGFPKAVDRFAGSPKEKRGCAQMPETAKRQLS